VWHMQFAEMWFENLNTKALFSVPIFLQLVYAGQTAYIFEDEGPLCFRIFHTNL
jgi:hypothetical protein